MKSRARHRDGIRQEVRILKGITKEIAACLHLSDQLLDETHNQRAFVHLLIVMD